MLWDERAPQYTGGTNGMNLNNVTVADKAAYVTCPPIQPHILARRRVGKLSILDGAHSHPGHGPLDERYH